MNCVKPVTVNGAQFACGRCVACRITRTSMWSLRMLHESSYWKDSAFITLTYDDDRLPVDRGLVKSDLQKFFKRLRKNTGRKLKYYGCGEYGEETKRPHYHAIVFGVSQEEGYLVEESWRLGFVHMGGVTADSIKYVASYVQKKWSGRKAEEEYGDRQAPFQVCSQGIGKRWLEDNKERIYSKLYITRKGVKVPVPKYYKDRLGINSEQTIGFAVEKLAEERRFFEERGIDQYDRSEYRRARAKQKEEELNWLEINRDKSKTL